MLDIFNDDAFSMASLTEAMNLIPHVPTTIGDMGLFRVKGVTTTSVAIEQKQGTLSIYSTGARGGGSVNSHKVASRNARNFNVPHIPVDFSVDADEVQDVRAFGEETRVETVSEIVTEKMTDVKENMDVTFEHHRAGAISGVVLDADGTTTIHNWFTEWGITEITQDFAFSTSTTDIKKLLMTGIIRPMRDNLGGHKLKRVVCLCGKDWFDDLTSHATVKDAFARWQDGEFLRTQQGGIEQGFKFGGVEFIEYRATVGSVDFIPDGVARFFPVGIPNLFQVHFAPANYVETVNTKGKPFYVKKANTKFDTGVDLQAQSNPLFVCTRPGALAKGTRS